MIMAYMNKEKKAKLAPAVKDICKKYGVKGTLKVHNHSTLILTVRSGKIDFWGSVSDDKREWTGEAKKFMEEVEAAMMVGNHNNSDIMTDYFDVGWYVRINIGEWDKPYIVK
jgi:hypothetical protein